MVRAGGLLCAGLPLAEALRLVRTQLEAAACPDADFDAADLLLLATGVSAHLAPPERLLSAAEAAHLAQIAARRAAREPLQYIWGRWPFLNFEVSVGAGVLCPRADTEIVTELAAQCCRAAQRAALQNTAQTVADALAVPLGMPSGGQAQATAPSATAQPVQVLELCGGSGCIGLGIKMFCPTAQVTALEKSPEALPYLRENAAHALDAFAAERPCGLAAPYIKVVEGDLFDYHATLPDAAFDLLVSNPPYLTAQEMTQLQPEVVQEPAMALAAGMDGLDFYRAIATDYRRVVKAGGYLVLEIGCAQAVDVMALLAEAGWQEITCRQDYGKNDRAILARRP